VVLAGRATAIAKTGDGPVEMARTFKLAKDSAIKSRTQATNQLKAVLVAADPALRESLPGLSNRVAHPPMRAAEPCHARRCHQRRGLDAAAAAPRATRRRFLTGLAATRLCCPYE